MNTDSESLIQSCSVYRLWKFWRDNVLFFSRTIFSSPGIVFPYWVSLITFVFPDTIFSPSNSLLYPSRLLISTPSLTFPCLTFLLHLTPECLCLLFFHSAVLYLLLAVGQEKWNSKEQKWQNPHHVLCVLILRCRELISGLEYVWK